MSTPTGPLTAAELDALRIAAIREQTDAIRAQADAINANTAGQAALLQAITAAPEGISDDLFKWTLQLVVNALSAKPVA